MIKPIEEYVRSIPDFQESRGFIFGVPIAYNLHKPFVPVRKKGNFLVKQSKQLLS